MEQHSLLPFVTHCAKLPVESTTCSDVKAKCIYLFASSLSQWSVLLSPNNLFPLWQLLWFAMSFLFFFISSLKTLAFLLALLWLCHKIPGPDFYFLHFPYLSNANAKSKYAYLKGEKLNIMITFQKVVYFKVKKVLVYLLLAVAFGYVSIKRKQKNFNWPFCHH